jgi:ribosomal protein L19
MRPRIGTFADCDSRLDPSGSHTHETGGYASVATSPAAAPARVSPERYRRPSPPVPGFHADSYRRCEPSDLHGRSLIRYLEDIQMSNLNHDGRAEFIRPGSTQPLEVGCVIMVKSAYSSTDPRTETLVGVVLEVEKKGLRTSFLMRGFVGANSFEVRYPLFSPRVLSIEILDRKKVNYPSLLYLRDKPKMVRTDDDSWEHSSILARFCAHEEKRACGAGRWEEMRVRTHSFQSRVVRSGQELESFTCLHCALSISFDRPSTATSIYAAKCAGLLIGAISCLGAMLHSQVAFASSSLCFLPISLFLPSVSIHCNSSGQSLRLQRRTHRRRRKR